jgi:hypothetical protein
MLKHPRIGRHSSCRSSGACLTSTSRRLQKEAPNSGYRVTESGERARSVTERRQYHRVVPGRPHNAQTSTPHALAVIHRAYALERVSLQRPDGLQKEAPNSGYRVTESDERARSVTERR